MSLKRVFRIFPTFVKSQFSFLCGIFYVCLYLFVIFFSAIHDTPTNPPLSEVVGSRTTSTTGDSPLDMTMTRGSKPPPSYSQSIASYHSAPARPSVITCAPPAPIWGADRSVDNKGTIKDENGRQGHRRELLSGEFYYSF